MLKFSKVSKLFSEPKLVQRLRFSSYQSFRWASTLSVDKETCLDEASLVAAKPFKDIPHLPILPLIGSSWIYMPIIGRFELLKQHIATVEKRKLLGDIFREKFGKVNLVFSFNADDMQILFKNEGPYPSRGEFASLQFYRKSRKEWYKTLGVIIMQGKEWHDLRSKTQKHLMKPKAVHAYLNPMQDVARDLVEKIWNCRDSNKEVPEFLGELYKWALESVAVVGLDTRLGCLKNDLTDDSDGMKMIKSVQTQFDLMFKLEAVSGNLQLWKYFPSAMYKRFAKASDLFTTIAFKYINHALDDLKSRTENDERDLTLLQSMLLTKGLDISGAMVTVSDMLLAGIDTTSHTVGFLLYHIARNPEKQELLYREIKSLLPRKEDRITPNILNELKFMKACIKESQRLDPIVGGVLRTIDHDIVLSGYKIPAGTFVIVALQSIYKDSKYFSNPKDYQPERWLNKEENFHPFAFLPFGVGTRSCLGRRIAELEIICLVTELIRNFRIEYHYEDIGMFTRLISTPDKPLRYTFIER